MISPIQSYAIPMAATNADVITGQAIYDESMRIAALYPNGLLKEDLLDIAQQALSFTEKYAELTDVQRGSIATQITHMVIEAAVSDKEAQAELAEQVEAAVAEAKAEDSEERSCCGFCNIL